MKKKDSEVIYAIVKKIRELQAKDKELGDTWDINSSLFSAEKWVQKKRKIDNQIEILGDILNEVY